MSTNIYTKIITARTLFLGAKVKKTGLNKYAGYDYFQLDDILPTCLRICSEVGICPMISFTNDTASMTVYDTESDQTITITSPMDSANLKGCHDIQNTGARETYSRRYLWFTLFEITEPDALDSTQGAPEGKPQQKTAKAPAKKDNSYIWGELLKYFGYKEGGDPDLNDYALSEAHKVIDPMGIKSPKGITDEQVKDITAFMEEPKGPEMFDEGNIDF